MTLFGICWFGFGLALAFWLASQPRRPNWVISPVTLYFWHSAFAIIYWLYSRSSPDPDSLEYFLTADQPTPFALGTPAVYWFMYHLKYLGDTAVGGTTYLDYFFVFNIFGYLGQFFFLSSLTEVADRGGVKPKMLILSLVLLPSISFWSVAIGKDAAMFLAINMIVFASLAPQKRWLLIVVGVGLAFVIRPQIGVIPIAAAALGVILTSRMSLWRRLATAAVAGAVMALLLPNVLEFLGLDAVDSTALADYIAARQGYNLEGGSSVDIRDLGAFHRAFVYLFRPLFFDAVGMAGYAVSAENLYFLLLTGSITIAGVRYGYRERPEPAIMFNLILFAVGIGVLSTITANLGIAVRQKMMFIPSALIVLVWAHSAIRWPALRANTFQ